MLNMVLFLQLIGWKQEEVGRSWADFSNLSEIEINEPRKKNRQDCLNFHLFCVICYI